MRSMDSILADEPSVHTLPESLDGDKERDVVTKAEPKAQASETPAKPEVKSEGTSGVPTEQKQASKSAEVHEEPDQDEEQHVPDNLDGLKRALAAARGDKRKARKQWQETERRLAELQGKLDVLQQQVKPAQNQPEPPKDPDLTDEAFYGKGPEAIKEYIRATMDRERQEQVRQRLYFSEMEARERHGDFDEAFAEFRRLATSDPDLWRKMNAAANPGEFVYKTGKTGQKLRDVSSLDEYERKLEAELRSKIRAEVEAEMAEAQQQSPSVVHQTARPPIPRTIAGARGNGVGATSAWAGPRPLSEILR